MSWRGKEFRFWSLGTVLLLAAVGGVLPVGFLTPATEACPTCSPGPCPPGTPYTSGEVTGSGATCEDAENDAVIKAFLNAKQTCGGSVIYVCNPFFVETQGCTYNSSTGEYEVKGQMYFNCADCV